MSVRYEVRIADPFGTPLALLANFVDNPSGGGSALGYTLSAGNIGALQLTIPASFDTRLLPLDARISVWRSVNGRPAQREGDTDFLLRTWDYGQTTTTITAYSANHLLKRRIINYFSGTSYSSKTAGTPAGNLIKAFVNENMLGGITADRRGTQTQANINAYLSNQANLGDGASIALQCAWRNLQDVVTEIQDASAYAGTYLIADVVANGDTSLQLRTYAVMRGVDHRLSSGDPVILSPDTGTLENCRLVVDRSDEITVAIAGGQGEGTERLIATSIATDRIGDSPFNRIESFGDYSNISDASALQDVADAMVRAGRPTIEFTADVIETPAAQRGVQYNLGDMVTALFRNQQYDCRLDVIEVAVGGGSERSRAKLRSVT